MNLYFGFVNWNYHEHKLTGILAEYIDCIWWEDFAHANPNTQHHLLVPDKSIELIFTDAEIQRYIPSLKTEYTRKSQLCGLRTLPQSCTVRKSPLIGIRFIPGTFYQLVHVSPIETINSCLDPQVCLGTSVSILENNIVRASTQEDRVEMIVAYFEKEIKVLLNQPQDNVFEKAVHLIDKTSGNYAIDQLAKDQHVSIKTLERKFKKNLGLTPKKYSRLVRFVDHFLQTNLSPSRYAPPPAYDYYDHAHFIREVSAFSGLTPKQLGEVNLGIQEALGRQK